MAEVFDFIIVGGGTSGPVLANRLARTSSKPKVLLLEGGGTNDAEFLRVPDSRWSAFMNPSVNWGYISVPQVHLDGKEINCPRGRGLGGSSAINFSCWLIGHKEDFNEWADLVGDPCWKWDGEGGVKQRFRKIEKLDTNIDEKQAKFLGRDCLDAHSKDGMVDISFNQPWHEVESLSFQAAKEFGQPLNGDINSGDPNGFGLGPMTYHEGRRITAATAYLSSSLSNLTILTENIVARIVFDDSKKAVAVETRSGQVYHARSEVILSAGAFDSPKILLSSGIGPESELSKLSIPIIYDLPGVGKNMKDHCFVTTTLLLKTKTGTENPDVQAAAPTVVVDPLHNSSMAWLSSVTIKSSQEFSSLPEETQTFLNKVPSYEFIINSIPFAVHGLPPNAEVITFSAVVMNAQSTGSITLSSNPSDPPLIDPNFVSHPYDRRVAIEALRDLVEYSQMPAFAAVTEKRIEGPASDSEEDLWEHVKKALQPVNHFAGTCRMGRGEDEMAVVDKEFKVKGIKGLRVVDHSIAPLMVNNHVQSTCYLIGETAAEKIIAEYDL